LSIHLRNLSRVCWIAHQSTPSISFCSRDNSTTCTKSKTDQCTSMNFTPSKLIERTWDGCTERTILSIKRCNKSMLRIKLMITHAWRDQSTEEKCWIPPELRVLGPSLQVTEFTLTCLIWLSILDQLSLSSLLQWLVFMACLHFQIATPLMLSILLTQENIKANYKSQSAFQPYLQRKLLLMSRTCAQFSLSIMITWEMMTSIQMPLRLINISIFQPANKLLSHSFLHSQLMPTEIKYSLIGSLPIRKTKEALLMTTIN